MFAVIRTGGKQYKVAKDDVIIVEKLAGEPGATRDARRGADGRRRGRRAQGRHADARRRLGHRRGACEHKRGDKVIVFKKKRRHNYRRKNGHRQALTVLRITGITAG